LRRFHHNKPCILALAYKYCMTRKHYTHALPHHTTIRQYRYTRLIIRNNKE
jgi:hypothetical protein